MDNKKNCSNICMPKASASFIPRMWFGSCHELAR